jgi:ABC-2 type transport system ATP-binding protein
LAQAFLGNPPLLILDEPSSGLDPYQNVEMRDILKEASKEQAILLSSHVLSEISAICNRVVILSNGQLVADDTPAGLKESLRQPDRFYVIGEGRMEEFQKVAQESGWLSDIQVRRWERPGAFRAEFQSEEKDVAAKVLCILKKAGVSLIQLGVNLPDLEESYFHLTKDQRYDTRI